MPHEEEDQLQTTFSTLIDSKTLIKFKTIATAQNKTIRQAVDEALEAWIKLNEQALSSL